MSYSVGDTVTLDGIESVIIYKAEEEQNWGQYIVTDKNHDLCYYISGDDYVDILYNDKFPGAFGYEWGGYGRITYIDSIEIGDGLSNTNSLIDQNLPPRMPGWRVVWDMVERFRSTHSDDWFVPSLNELQQVYTQRSYLKNLSITTNPYYWSSSERAQNYAHNIDFSNKDSYNYINKDYQSNRTRLCRYTTDSELNKKVWILDEIITSTELNRIENRIQEVYSSYSPTSWSAGDVLSKDRLNKIETQLGTDKVWEDGNIVTADDLNNIENLLI